MPYLEVVFLPRAHWSAPLQTAIQAKPALADAYARWGTSKLSDLGFAIETRLAALGQIVRDVGSNLQIMGRELGRDPDVAAYVAGGIAYRFQDEEALPRVLIGAAAFIAEWGPGRR